MVSGRRAVVVLLVSVVAAWCALVAAAWILQRRLIYFPSSAIPTSAIPPGSGEVTFSTADGLRLSGWLVPADRAEPIATVLVCNGNGGNRSHRAPLARALSRAGFSVLLFDYRGYSGSGGVPSERGLVEDARAARTFLETQPGVRRERIVYYGESLGAAVALALAIERPPAALVLRSPFTSLADVGAAHYPLLPVRLMLHDRYDSLARIATLRAPLLVIAGAEDRLIPPDQSRALHDAARVPKRFVLVTGADHNDAALLDGPELIREVASFVAVHAPS